MPRAKVSPTDRLNGWVDTYEDLGSQLGSRKPIHRNTLSAWAKRGAPKGPPYSVIEWYTWAIAKGYQVAKPRDERLRAIIDAGEDAPEIGPDIETDEDGRPKLPGTPTPYDALVTGGHLSFSTAREREQLRGDMLVVQQREISVASARVEHEKAKGSLIPRDESTKAAAIVFNAFVREGELLAEAVVQALAKHPHSLRAEVSVAVKAAWSTLLEHVGKESPHAAGR